MARGPLGITSPQLIGSGPRTSWRWRSWTGRGGGRGSGGGQVHADRAVPLGISLLEESGTNRFSPGKHHRHQSLHSVSFREGMWAPGKNSSVRTGFSDLLLTLAVAMMRQVFHSVGKDFCGIFVPICGVFLRTTPYEAYIQCKIICK